MDRRIMGRLVSLFAAGFFFVAMTYAVVSAIGHALGFYIPEGNDVTSLQVVLATIGGSVAAAILGRHRRGHIHDTTTNTKYPA